MSTSEAQEASLKRMLWVGAAGALLAALAGMFGIHDGSVWRMPGALEARVQGALEAHGLGGIDVAMDGQRAMLRGVVPDAASINAASEAALHAAGLGGPWAGGITHVDVSGLSAGEVARPFAWSVSRQGERLILSGAAPSDAARSELLAAAATSFPNLEIVDQMRTAGGAPAASWRVMAGNVIRAISYLERGEGRIVDREIAIIGDGAYDAVRRIRTDYADAPAPFHARVAASVDGLDTIYPELQGLDLRDAAPDVCAQAFTRLLDGERVTFEAGSPALTAEGRASLESIISVALRCDRNRLTVLGPADGGADLSRARATTVRDMLTAAGVTPARLQAAAGSGRTLAVAVDAAEAQP
jgi:OOP family OmpA-OmpF porin